MAKTVSVKDKVGRFVKEQAAARGQERIRAYLSRTPMKLDGVADFEGAMDAVVAAMQSAYVWGVSDVTCVAMGVPLTEVK